MLILVVYSRSCKKTDINCNITNYKKLFHETVTINLWG
jgi:hypothetical protein